MAPFGGHGSSGSGRGGFRGGRGGRGGRVGYGGPQLPTSLLEQVDAKYGSGGKRDITRKEKRKVARDDRKGPAQTQKTRRRQPPSDEDEEQEEGEAEQPPLKKSKPSKDQPASSSGKSNSEKKEKKKKLPELTLPEESVGGDLEDREIEWLEYMLRKEKGKSKGEDDLDDGLDDLLNFAEAFERGGKGVNKQILDDENDEGIFDFGEENEDDAEEESEEDQDEDDDEDNETDLDEDEEEEFMGFSDQGDQEEEGDVSEEEDASPAQEKHQTRPDNEEPSVSLNPAPSSSTDASAPTKYIPPHLRAAQLEEKAKGNKEKAEEKIRLERKAQGLLNRLSEQNIESILTELETLYRNHSRNDVTTALTDLIIQMISNKANLLDSFVVLYATLVGALHRVIGMEFGAHFIHTLITKYSGLQNHSSSSAEGQQSTTIQATIYETPDAGKESLNLLTLIAELYNAQVVGSRLIYDLVRGFLEGEGKEGEVMGEREVEGLLKILRCSGAQLRTDDPASLKDIVNLVQEKTKGKEKTMTARARFMVETLTNVKNGKVKSSAASEAGNDAAQRMKKFLSGLGRKRRLLAYEPLRVSPSDLLSADKKGKWWLVGAGWSGNPLLELEQQREQGKSSGKTEKNGKKKEEKDSEAALLELARNQGMNTDVRRGVFVVLMTSEDYVHACDRLSMFKLSDVQQREFVRVALHCCGLEATYNPYYTLILSHLCANSYDHRFTFQYALWDFMRELESGSKVSKEKVGNVARAVGYVVARGGLSLTVFKAVDFTSLCKPLIKFLITVLVHLAIALQTVSPIFTLPKSYELARNFDDEVIQERFEQVLSNTELAGGWLWVLDREMKDGKNWEEEVTGERERVVVKKSLEIAQNVLRAAAL
ncbi:MIF4G/MA4 domain-containing protein [Cryptococcus neoformans A2-102-5]|nr:MIF4G/MA4 domain-containing protein [Cryptococcus neoformans var. grubii D17-1]OXG92523.1 MIF4G/MA4 domain-containing protein [Cryptococcus neoformans var. grubii A2-102-5]